VEVNVDDPAVDVVVVTGVVVLVRVEVALMLVL
jgi:hypothetical protein